VHDIEQFSRVFGQPVVGLDIGELGRGPAVADDLSLAVLLALAEPLNQHSLAV
jgi:hypothetical protein